MPADVPIPDGEAVYRGMRNANWIKGGKVQYKAFLLRPANELYPIAEDELSLGRTADAAVNELKTHYGAASLIVGEVHALPYALKVVEDPADSLKAYMLGLPLHSTDELQIGLAVAIATDLAFISQIV
jgi:hypothetical protein